MSEIPSERLRRLIRDLPDGEVRLGRFFDLLGRDAAGIALLILTIPTLIPIPGLPTGVVFGGALLVLAAQMLVGRMALPSRLARLTIRRERLALAALKVLPWIERLERYVKPRLGRLSGARAMRIWSLLVAAIGLLLIVPLPFANMPPAVAGLILAVGMIARDGAAMLAGAFAALLSAAWIVALLAGTWWGASGLFQSF
jgi:hypothetical protein